MGKPRSKDMNVKEATNLVDIILDGDYGEYKKIRSAVLNVDSVLDEIENDIDHTPNQDLQALHQSVVDELTKDELTPTQEAIAISISKLIREEDYRTFFKKMMKSWNIDSIEDLSDEKKKKFFDAVDKAWKADKETD
jgi:uncharacterized membrane-anchored protein YjiN (DUF445 family)